MDSTIRWLEEVDGTDVDNVGLQAAALGELLNAHVSVPYGFVIPKHEFERFCSEHAIATLFASGSVDDVLHLLAVLPIDHGTMSSIAHAYHELPKRARRYLPQKPLSTMHPFTGLYRISSVEISVSCSDSHSFINHIPRTKVVGENALFHAIRAVWIQALRTYLTSRNRGGYAKMIQDGPSIIVQQVLKPQFSGSAYLDSLDKNNLIISTQNSDETYHVFLPTTEIREDSFPTRRNGDLSREMLQAIANQYKKVQKIRYLPFVISWVIHENQVYVPSVQDISVQVDNLADENPAPNRHILVRGTSVLPGHAYGPVHFVSNGSMPKPGSILVTTNPLALRHDMIKHAAAIIFEEDDIGIDHLKEQLPHSIPVIKGIRHAGPALKHEHMVTIDGTRAEVLKANRYGPHDLPHRHRPVVPEIGIQMYAWVESIQELPRALSSTTDGLLLDSQVLLKDLETDHKSVLHKADIYESYFEKRVSKIARDLFPRPLIVVTTPTTGFDLINHISYEERVTISQIESKAIQRARASGMTNIQTSSFSEESPTTGGDKNEWLYVKTPAEALDLAYYDNFSYVGAIISIDDLYMLIHGLENLGSHNSLPSYDKTTESFIQGVLQKAKEKSISVILLSKYIPFSETILVYAVEYRIRSLGLPLTYGFEEVAQKLHHIQHNHG